MREGNELEGWRKVRSRMECIERGKERKRGGRNLETLSFLIFQNTFSRVECDNCGAFSHSQEHHGNMSLVGLQPATYTHLMHLITSWREGGVK